MTRLPEFHAAKWDEPVVMELGRPGGRGQLFPAPEAEVTEAVGAEAERLGPERRSAEVLAEQHDLRSLAGFAVWLFPVDPEDAGEGLVGRKTWRSAFMRVRPGDGVLSIHQAQGISVYI